MGSAHAGLRLLENKFQAALLELVALDAGELGQAGRQVAIDDVVENLLAAGISL